MAAIPVKASLIIIPEVDGWQGWVVLGLVGFMLLALVAELAPPHLVMMGTLIICLSLNIINLSAAFHGFSDQAMLSVAVLFVVAKGIEMSGGLEYMASVLFKAPNKASIRPGSRPSPTEGSIVWVLLKFCVPVAIFSAFLANIPLVAMMIPPILEFANKVKMAPSKMLIPLSYAAQLGGTMTLIGAGTNLVVLSMSAQKLPELHMSIFEIGVVGLPITIAGIFYLVAFSGKLLPNRVSPYSTAVVAREYNILVAVKDNSKLAHRSIDWSGLSRQPGLDLVAITRNIETILDPKPDMVLLPKDLLHFVGVIDSILLLAQVYGLKLTEDEGRGEVDLNLLKATQILVEAVIASGSSMVHERIADLQCRTRFNSTIAAIHRHGTRLTSLIGEIRVEAGDCLLMVADSPDFVAKHRTNSHFALVSQLPGFKPLNRKKASIATILVVSLVVASGAGANLLMCALLSSAGLLITRCLTPLDAMEAIELPVVIMIAAAFGIAEAMVESGAATILAKALMGLAGKSMFGLISCTYIATTLFSLAITNSAAVTIMFPVALAAANHQALDFRPFAYTLMMGASAGFMTPTACPTNLMVYSPGSYKFSDYIHFGGPLQLWLLFVTVGVTMSLKYWYVWAIVIFAMTCGAIPLIARHKSTHPTQVGDAAAADLTKSGDGEHDDENPGAALNAAGRELMLAPGHDNEETITRRMSQTTIPPTVSSSAYSVPSTFSSPFPPPYRLEDSNNTSSSSSSTGTSHTNRDFGSFPAPYRLDESPIPTFPSLRTSLSGKAAQLIIYDPKAISYDSNAFSSTSSAPTTNLTTVVTIAPLPAPVVPLGPQTTQQESSQSSSATNTIQIIPSPKTLQIIVSPKTDAPRESRPKPDTGPYRTRQSLVQAFSSPVLFSSPQSHPLRISSNPTSASFGSTSSSSYAAASAGPVQALDRNVDSSLFKPFDDSVESFTDVNISEDSNSSSNSDPKFLTSSKGPAPPVGPLTAGGSSETGAGGLLSKLLRPSFSARLSAGGDPQSQPPTTPRNAERSPVLAVGGSAKFNPKEALQRIPAYSRPSNVSGRKPSRSVAPKAAKSPRPPTSGRGSPAAVSKAAPSVIVSNEENVTGGISNLMATRRLSSLNDASAFADNVGIVDHQGMN